MSRTDVPTSWDERATLLTMLAYTRDTAVEKSQGLSPELAATAPLTTSPLMTVAGVLNHLRWVEYDWIERHYAGGPDLGPWTEQSPDQEFLDGTAASLETVVADYAAQAARTAEIVAKADLDDLAVHPLNTGDRPTLRWILLHLIEENARHNGHLDILRELADGVTGD